MRKKKNNNNVPQSVKLQSGSLGVVQNEIWAQVSYYKFCYSVKKLQFWFNPGEVHTLVCARAEEALPEPLTVYCKIS